MRVCDLCSKPLPDKYWAVRMTNAEATEVCETCYRMLSQAVEREAAWLAQLGRRKVNP